MLALCARAVFVAFSSTLTLAAQVIWSQATPAISPPARCTHAMVYDSQRGVVVMHGGTSSWLTAHIVLDAHCVSTSWTTAEFALPIPYSYGLVGLALYMQAWTLQPGFNTTGIVTSNGLALTVGDI